MKLSIITINLNNAEGLRKTIDSVLSQTFKDYEYIVIDGGSKDSSVEIIQQYSDKIAYWVSEPDKGIYNAMNKGISQSVGKYCLFLNSGDYLLSSTVINDVFQKNDTSDIIISARPESFKLDSLKFSDLYSRINIPFCHQQMLIKRELFETIGLYDEDYVISSDYYFFVISLLRNSSIYYIDFDLAGLQPGGISQTCSFSLYLEDRKIFMTKNFPLFQDDYGEYERYRKSTFIHFYDKYSQFRNNSYNQLRNIKLLKKIYRSLKKK